MQTASLIGLAAAVASTTSFVPQAWKTVKTRKTEGISVGMYVITVAGFGLWLAYGLLLGQWPLMISNSICLVLSAFILMMKLLSRPSRDVVAATLTGGD